MLNQPTIPHISFPSLHRHHAQSSIFNSPASSSAIFTLVAPQNPFNSPRAHPLVYRLRALRHFESSFNLCPYLHCFILSSIPFTSISSRPFIPSLYASRMLTPPPSTHLVLHSHAPLTTSASAFTSAPPTLHDSPSPIPLPNHSQSFSILLLATKPFPRILPRSHPLLSRSLQILSSPH